MNSLAVKVYQFYTELFKSGQQKFFKKLIFITLAFMFY